METAIRATGIDAHLYLSKDVRRAVAFYAALLGADPARGAHRFPCAQKRTDDDVGGRRYSKLISPSLCKWRITSVRCQRRSVAGHNFVHFFEH